MKLTAWLTGTLWLVCFIQLSQGQSFKTQQLNHPNVKTAYLDKSSYLKGILAKRKLNTFNNHLYIRVFKEEEIVELWVKAPDETRFKPLKSYRFCERSGGLGPKHSSNDGIVPEGLYHLKGFIPNSADFLALLINYPNPVDRFHQSGSAQITLKGGCTSNSDIPISDDKIKEVYVMAVQAYESGQKRIPVHIFPAKMTDTNMHRLKIEHAWDKQLTNFWGSLKAAYDYFNMSRQLPQVFYSATGEYAIKDYEGIPIVSPKGISVFANASKPTPAPPKTVPLKSQEKVPPVKSAPPAYNPAPTIRNVTTRTVSVKQIASSSQEYHTVQRGETLFAISRKYQVSVTDLKRWNNLNGNVINVGYALRVGHPKTYQIQRGDTMYSVARKNGISVRELMVWNGKNDYTLQIGEIVKVGR
ncbi:LysM peptidoglycan-binding domain-containing protein [Rapidithrix thailandica]|uniref:LysM peptidoglycan-binding domain-containing protein n=1 Tax=Rapidithrix thailandica TaxID=413964 RepID=A0AAW9RZB6_9BACT